MGALPNLSASFTRRFDVASDGTLLPPDGYPSQDYRLSEVVLIPRDEVTVNPISNVAKLDESGQPINRWNYELPPMAIVGMMQNIAHVRGIAYKDKFPFKLKALGRINAAQIMLGQGSLVSDDVVVVP